MDQSKSNSAHQVAAETLAIPVPKRSFSLEFFVGLFAMVSLAAAAYLAIGLGELEIGGSNNYEIYADFDNVSGLKNGASVEIAGVQVGYVQEIKLSDPKALVVLKLNEAIKIKDDDILSIRTKGIIGDRYVKISRGASETLIPAKGTIIETESVIDIEDVIGKFVHSLSSDDKEKDKEK